jgi:hypothetical protein
MGIHKLHQHRACRRHYPVRSLPPGVARRDLMAALKAQRAITPTKRGPSPNVEVICRSWPNKFDKMQLAEVLWPVLQAKVQRDLTSGKRLRVPAARVADRALRMALEISGHNIALRVR